MRVHANAVLPHLLPGGHVIIGIKQVSLFKFMSNLKRQCKRSPGCEKHGSLRTNSDFTLY